MFSTHRETLKRSASVVTCTLDGQTKWIAGHSPRHAQLGHWHLARLHQLTTFLSSYNCFSYTQLSNRKHTVSSRGDWITNSLFTWYCLCDDIVPGCQTGIIQYVIAQTISKLTVMLDTSCVTAATLISTSPGHNLTFYHSQYFISRLNISSPKQNIFSVLHLIDFS